MKKSLLALAGAVWLLGMPVQAQTPNYAGTPPAVAAKLSVRGDMQGVNVPEMRVVRRNDILSVQSDLVNTATSDRVVYYRYRWLDAYGNQVGDGESWKQLQLMGLGLQTVKSVAPTSATTDFRLEMNIEAK